MTIFQDVETRGLEMEIIKETIPYEDDNDGKDHLAHLINQRENEHIWQPGMSAQDIVDIARATGQEVRALCGYMWVPKRNPEKYPSCQACFDIAGQIMSEDG